MAEEGKILTDEKENKLIEKEKALNERELALNEREENLKNSEQDTQALVKSVKDEYENKLLKANDEFNKRLKDREAVIKQLLSDSGDTNKPKPTIIDKLNERRTAQNKKW